MVVARSQTKRYLQSEERDRPQTCRWVSSRVGLIKDTSNSIFTKYPIRRVFQNPVTYVESADHDKREREDVKETGDKDQHLLYML